MFVSKALKMAEKRRKKKKEKKILWNCTVAYLVFYFVRLQNNDKQKHDKTNSSYNYTQKYSKPL